MLTKKKNTIAGILTLLGFWTFPVGGDGRWRVTTLRALWTFSKGFFRYSWKQVLLVYDIDGYWKVSGKQSCSLMTKTLVEMFKGNASIRYNAFDLSKNPQNNLTENLRAEAGSKYSSKPAHRVRTRTVSFILFYWFRECCRRRWEIPSRPVLP